MDKLKIAVTKMTMLAERQLNYLFHDRINETLPPFVNLGKLGLNYGPQAAQFTATSTTAESQTLSNPMYVHSIPNNNDNQDIVSMGTNAAMLTRQVIENGYQVLAIEMLALVRAADYLSAPQNCRPRPGSCTTTSAASYPSSSTTRPNTGDRRHRKFPQTASMTEPTKYARHRRKPGHRPRDMSRWPGAANYIHQLPLEPTKPKGRSKASAPRAATGRPCGSTWPRAKRPRRRSRRGGRQRGRHRGGGEQPVGIRCDSLMMWMEPQQWHSVVDTGLGGFYNVTRPLLKGHAGQTFRPHRQHRLAVGNQRTARTDQLFGGQRRRDRGDEGAGAGGGKKGVTVNAIAAEFVRTDMTRPTSTKRNSKSRYPPDASARRRRSPIWRCSSSRTKPPTSRVR